MTVLYALSASDALALSLLGAMLLTLLSVGSLVLVMVKNVQKREAQDHELERMLSEISEDNKGNGNADEKQRSGNERDSSIKDWEKDADWWRKNG